MSNPQPDTWHNRDLPVLRAVVQLLESDRASATTVSLANATNFSRDQVDRALRNLQRGALLKFTPTMGGAVVDTVSGDALRATGAWPTPETALDRMIAALEAIAENTDDEDTRSRARKALDALTGAGRQIGVGVATAMITGQLPGAGS